MANLEEDLDVIGWVLYASEKELRDGLPGGDDHEWGYDEQLVADIANAVRAWRARHSEVE